MVEKTHLFYLDHETRGEATDLQVDDRLIWSSGKYSVLRGGHRLMCAWANGTESGEKFSMPDGNPIHGALDLAEMYRLSVHIMHGDKRQYVDDDESHEWLFA